MFVRWEHKSFSKGSGLQGLCFFLAGAFSIQDKKEDVDLKKIGFLVLGLFAIIGLVYLVSAVQEISTVL